MIGKLKSYAALGLDWLLAQFDDAGNFQRIIKAVGDEVDEIETATHDLLTDRFLFADDEDKLATGAALDQYGDLVDQPRNGRPDDIYRELIRIKILRNASEGTPPRLIEIMKRLTKAATIEYSEGKSEAELIAWDVNPIQGVREEIHEILQDAAPLGVRVRLIEADSQDSFQYDSGPGYDSGRYAGRL